ATVLQKVTAKNRVRRTVLTSVAAPSQLSAPVTLRPRIASDSAILRFSAAVERAGWRVPPALERRHKAGLEMLLAALAEELIDGRKLHDLEELAALEPWGRSRAPRFTPI
ncbi:MAG TPA: hypothetical protein VFL80_10985, partial [Thermoanaerobaculia bacterium]|nr:hypothetical protein [Thermoanaerobaculia bacterium]